MTVEDPPGNAAASVPHGRAVATRRRHAAAWHHISAEPGYLRSELFNRHTAEETKKFLEAVLAAALGYRLPYVLICVRNSVPIFTVERYGFSSYLELAFKSRYKIALVADTIELRIAHQYIATMARIRGVRLRAFASEAEAVHWLTFWDNSSGSPDSL
jgi:hypothetical protein